MRKTVLKFGTIGGVIISVLMTIAMVFHDEIGFDRGLIVGYSSMVLAFLMVYFGVRAYREELGGTISFGKAFKAGILITLLTCAFYVATWQVVYRTVMPDFGDRYATYVLDKARAEGATEAEIEKQRAEMADFMEMYQNPLVNIAFTTMEPLPVGLLFTLLTAGLLSRKRREDGAAA